MDSIVDPAPDDKIDTPAPCTTMGCPHPATLVGTYVDHDIAFRNVAYCAGCAGYLYQQFTPDGTVEYDDCGHHSWAGLMALLDEHWPEDIFPTRYPDDIKRDAGARIVSLLRWIDRLRGDV